MPISRLRIGTRGSPLALAQAREVSTRLGDRFGVASEDIAIVVFRTAGDRIQDRPLADAGGKGLFTREIEMALIEGRIDVAVHSMKDMPTLLPDGLVVAAMMPREDVRDAFVSPVAPSLAALPSGARIGTSSLRRAAQLRRARPDVRIVPLRGNVETRLRKIGEGEAEATLLAVAGLNRLRMADRITAPIPEDIMLPAVGQGAIGIEVREEDAERRGLIATVDDRATSIAVGAERAFLARLEGSCRTPIAGLARLEGDSVRFRGEVLSPDGAVAHRIERIAAAADAEAMAEAAADELLTMAGPGFLGEHG